MHKTGDAGCGQEADRSRLNECPTQKCDLIMKGGVTSGVVYPPAILKLAERYRFHAIGGASAGAIAAAAAAAAEYGRQAAPGPVGAGAAHGFVGLAGMNDELRGEHFVRKLFKPSKRSAPLFKAFLTWQEWGRKQRKRARVLQALGTVLRLNLVCLKSVPGRYLLGVLLGAAVSGALLWGTFFWGLGQVQEAEGGYWLLGGAAVLVTLAVCGASGMLGGLLSSGLAFKSIVTGLRNKDEDKFGICPGSDGPQARLKEGKDLALTDWLHVRLNALAGRGPEDPPITVAELRMHEVHFKLMTSNLTLGQPYILPMKRGSRSFFFKRRDMERLFPAPVVKALVEWGEKHRPTDSVRIRDEDAKDFLRFPMGEDIPLVVATRLSLSFPMLLSAVRLYSVKGAKYQKLEGKTPQTLDLANDVEEHWWSDGGITSNFPIHVFDSWVPQHPTFGITLYDSPLPKVLEQREGVRPSMSPHEAVVLPFPRDFDKARPRRTAINDTLGFLRAIFETAQSYRDNAQAGMPSYRERVLQLFLEGHEGGLNLDMPSEVIESIQAKGRCAAQELLERYDTQDGIHFAEHRWVRMHVLMAELERQLFEVRDLFQGPDWNEKLRERFAALFAVQSASQAPPWYRNKDAAWCAEASRRLDALLELIEEWDTAQRKWKAGYTPGKLEDPEFFFAAHPPRPQGVLKVTPDL